MFRDVIQQVMESELDSKIAFEKSQPAPSKKCRWYGREDFGALRLWHESTGYCRTDIQEKMGQTVSFLRQEWGHSEYILCISRRGSQDDIYGEHHRRAQSPVPADHERKAKSQSVICNRKSMPLLDSPN